MPRATFTARQLAELRDLHPVLWDVLIYLVETWPIPELVVTSIRRTEAENKEALARTKVHVVGPPWRAVDIRVFTLGDDFQKRALSIAGRVNRRWTYDPDRPRLRVAFARTHGTGPHIHLQVHPNSTQTELRAKEVTT